MLKANQGDEGLELAIQENPHLIILDVMLPKMSGFDVLRELRQKGIKVPIIMLTAKSEEIDRVVGLEIGADDYVTKPFSVRELLARIRVQLRRQPPEPAEILTRFRFGSVEIDFEKLQATRKDKPLDLTAKELDILRLLIQRRGQVITRNQLLDEVWGYEKYPTTRTVDNHILKLRKKLEDDPTAPKYILTIYGQGYKFIG